MPITTIHPACSSRLTEWQRCRTVAQGADAVKDAAETYLPKLEGQADNDYKAYKTRAEFYNATGRTISGLVGSLMRKDPIVNVPTSLEDLLEDVTLLGDTIHSFAQWLAQEIITTGRVGITVDFVVTPENAIRPFLSGYCAESITNWRIESINKTPTLTLLVLKERECEDQTDPFEPTYIEQYRAMRLIEGRLYIETYRWDDEHNECCLYETVMPTIRDVPLTFIPFCFINTYSISATTDKPPLLDLVDTNLSHYRNSADLEHGLHYTALPTPWLTGFPIETELSLGPQTAWITQNENAKVGMLEFTGSGLSSIAENMTRKETRMAVLGSRILEEKTPSVESAETIKERNSSERGVMASIATMLSVGLTKTMRWFAEFAGAPIDNVSVDMNKDFVSATLKGQELTALIAAWQGGAVSWPTLYFNLQRGEVARPNVTEEEELDLIEQEAMKQQPTDPTGEGFPANTDNDDDNDDDDDDETNNDGEDVPNTGEGDA